MSNTYLLKQVGIDTNVSKSGNLKRKYDESPDKHEYEDSDPDSPDIIRKKAQSKREETQQTNQSVNYSLGSIKDKARSVIVNDLGYNGYMNVIIKKNDQLTVP